jgi:hypothetical protein
MSEKITILGPDKTGALQAGLSRAAYEVRSQLAQIRASARRLRLLGPRSRKDMIRGIGLRPIIFSINCHTATILTMFVAFTLEVGCEPRK